MELFSPNENLSIGRIIEVKGPQIRVELEEDIDELNRLYAGEVYPIGQFGSIVKIHYRRKVLFAFVSRLRMVSEIEFEDERPVLPATQDARVLEANLFGGGYYHPPDRVDFNRGVHDYPLPQQKVYLTTSEELQLLYKGIHNTSGKQDSLIPIGEYVSSSKSECFANADKLFGHHSAILGSTGSGKSATVASMLHSLLEEYNGEDSDFSPKVVLIDPHGEYASAFENDAIIFNCSPEENSVANELKLPYWLMSGEELRELIIGKTEREATSQNNIVYKALEHSRLVEKSWIEETKEWEGEEVDDCDIDHPENHRLKEGTTQEQVQNFNRDKPHPFKLNEFENHIKQEQEMRVKHRKWEKKAPSKRSSYESILDKLKVLRNDPRRKFLMEEYSDDSPDLEEILQQFIGNPSELDDKPLRIVDISNMPNEIAGLLTSMIARLLFEYKTWQKAEERKKDPILTICEEAHKYVPRSGKAQYQAAQKSIKRIAKEGRKYGLGLMLVSQRPSDIDSTVLSQCNSWIVLRLTNESDQTHVKQFLPDNLQGLTSMLPALTRREGIFVGEAASIPSRIFIKELEDKKLPDSSDIKFIKGWENGPTTSDEIAKVTERWRNDNG